MTAHSSNEYMRAWKKANPDKIREYSVKYRENHREEINQYIRERRAANRERYNEYQRAYYALTHKCNPDLMAEWRKKYVAEE